MNPSYQLKTSYLVRFENGAWQMHSNVVYMNKDDWPANVVDVIHLKTAEYMVANWWEIKNSRKVTKKVDENELTLYLLQAEHVSLV